MSGTDTEIDIAEPEVQLSHLLPALWKSLTRATRGAERLPALESEVSILRMIVDVGPMAPAQLADRLYLARPTVSNLLKSLETSRLVTRERSEADGRSVLIAPTDYGREVLDQFRHGRMDVLAEALNGLSARDRRSVVTALPALDRLLERIEQIAASLPPEQQRPL